MPPIQYQTRIQNIDHLGLVAGSLSKDIQKILDQSSTRSIFTPVTII